jgi:dimeric dUTPase (all-alpha-NTP-PPase superfamily)
MLQKLLDEQQKLNHFLEIKRGLRPMEGSVWVAEFLTALIHEAVEARDETNWKWWKETEDIDHDKLKEELVDCLHFLLSAFLAEGMDAEEIVDLYLKKKYTNIERQG